MKNGGSTNYGHKFDYHFPYALYRDKDYKEGKENAIEAVKDGMKVTDAIVLCFEIHWTQAYKWLKWAEEDLEKGFTSEDSRLIELVLALAKEEYNLKRRLEKRANQLALDEEETNIEMLKFLLERRHGYTKQTQNDVDVTVNEEAPIKFEFTDMTPTENED